MWKISQSTGKPQKHEHGDLFEQAKSNPSYIYVTDIILFLQDSLQALCCDCSFPAIRRNKNVENFLNRCK